MKITVKHFPGQHPQFNVSLHTTDTSEPFIEIKGCRIVHGSNGEFVSWPSRKQEDGKYWNHVYASDNFNAAVLKIAKESAPAAQRPAAPQRQAPRPQQAAAVGGFDDMDSDIPW